MTRKTAIQSLFTMICARAAYAEPEKLFVPMFSHTGEAKTYNEISRITIPNPDEVTYTLVASKFNLCIDGRKFTITAKEMADALEQK